MGKSTCRIPGCEKPLHYRARQLCSMHAERLRKTGTFDPPPPRPTLEERFWAKVDKRGPDDCWLWTAATNQLGYGQIGTGSTQRLMAHRCSYELAYGPIPDGMMVDHRCGVPLCVNPAHLRVVTPSQNMENRTKLDRRNGSGFRGVSWDREKCRWFAYCSARGVRYSLGYFDDVHQAAEAARLKRLEVMTCNDQDRPK